MPEAPKLGREQMGPYESYTTVRVTIKGEPRTSGGKLAVPRGSRQELF